MQKLIKKFSKFVIKIFIADIFLIGLSFIISYFSKITINDILVYVGIFCILIGMLSVAGNSKNSADATYFISKSVGTKSMNEISEENLKSRNSSMDFLIFMLCSGGFLVAIGAFIDYIFK